MSFGLRYDLFHGKSRSITKELLIMSVTLTSARCCAPMSCSLESSDTLTTNSFLPGRLPYLVYAASHSCLASVDGSRWSSLASSCLRSTSSLPQRASSTSSLWTLSSISKQQCSMKIDLGRTCEDVSVVILAVGDGDFAGIHSMSHTNRIDSPFWQFPITFQRCQHSDTLADQL